MRRAEYIEINKKEDIIKECNYIIESLKEIINCVDVFDNDDVSHIKEQYGYAVYQLSELLDYASQMNDEIQEATINEEE